MDMEGLRDRSKMNLQVATRFARACATPSATRPLGSLKLIFAFRATQAQGPHHRREGVGISCSRWRPLLG